MGSVPNFTQDQLNIYDAQLLAVGLWNTVRLCGLGLLLGLVIAFVGRARSRVAGGPGPGCRRPLTSRSSATRPC